MTASVMFAKAELEFFPPFSVFHRTIMGTRPYVLIKIASDAL